MTDRFQQPGPDLLALYSLFAAGGAPQVEAPAFEVVRADGVPQPYRALLVHEHHMTVTVEAHHGEAVRVRILAVHRDADVYARKILLELERSGRVVQFGIVRVDLSVCAPAVRSAIEEGKTPFGRILIEHNVMRRIEPTAYLRLTPDAAMCGWFGLDAAQPVYGRLAYIHYDGRRAVELLEVVAP